MKVECAKISEKVIAMTSRPAKITTPIPTLDELGKRLGVSKARQREIISIVRGEKNGHVKVRIGGTKGQIAFRKSAAVKGKSGKRASSRS